MKTLKPADLKSVGFLLAGLRQVETLEPVLNRVGQPYFFALPEVTR